MPIYDKPVRILIRDLVAALAPKQGQSFSKDDAIEWFARNYPKIKEGTITAHLIRFSTNAPSRLHYSVRSDEDLLYQIDGSRFRPFDPARDPAPIHAKSDVTQPPERPTQTPDSADSSEFSSSASPPVDRRGMQPPSRQPNLEAAEVAFCLIVHGDAR